MLNSVLAVFVACALGLGVAHVAQAEGMKPRLEQASAADNGLELFKLADRRNLKRLSNGDFLFRLALDRSTGVVYWAYMGTTQHVIAMVPNRGLLADDGAARRILLRISDLPTRVGCGVGLIHQSKVYVVPEDAEFGSTEYDPNVTPLYVVGEVRNDTSERTPTTLLSYRNFVSEN